MDLSSLRYRPSLEDCEIQQRLAILLPPGRVNDPTLERQLAHLGESFRNYAALLPHGLWAPGLAITPEMRGLAEIYLPLDTLRPIFSRLLRLSLSYWPFLRTSALHTSTCWLDLLEQLAPLPEKADPAHLLRRLMADADYRCRFLFALFLPSRYGSGFNRYPTQSAFLRRWLRDTPLPARIRCLDAACGNGAGTYELALLLLQQGFPPDRFEVHGSTLEPLELFAAAHGWLPHDPPQQAAFRAGIAPLFVAGADQQIEFFHEDLCGAKSRSAAAYDIILCNGLLGGPLLYERGNLAGVIGRLAGRLRQGGILLAADRFHAGWKRQTPSQFLRELLAGNCLQLIDLEQGVAAVKESRGAFARP